MPLFLHCCHLRPPIILCRLSLWSSELVLPTLEISQSESITCAATRSVCLRKSRTFCSPPPTFGCSIFLDPPINRFVWKRRIFTKNIAARKQHTHPHVPVTFLATICFKIHAPSPSGISLRQPAPRPTTRSVILQSCLLMSALKKKKKKEKLTYIYIYIYIFFFSFVLFRYFLMDKNAQGVFSPQS